MWQAVQPSEAVKPSLLASAKPSTSPGQRSPSKRNNTDVSLQPCSAPLGPHAFAACRELVGWDSPNINVCLNTILLLARRPLKECIALRCSLRLVTDVVWIQRCVSSSVPETTRAKIIEYAGFYFLSLPGLACSLTCVRAP